MLPFQAALCRTLQQTSSACALPCISRNAFSSATQEHPSSTITPAKMLYTYESLVHNGKLLPNDSQRHAAYALQLLQESLLEASAQPETSKKGPLPIVRGAYLYGHVGCGKTFLMDTFASSTAASLPLLHSNPWSNSKRSAPEEADTSRINTGAEPDMDSSSSSSRTPLVWRLHYNEFMKHMHGRLHAVEARKPKVLSRGWNGRPVYRTLPSASDVDPFQEVAKEIAEGTLVLAIDELHVTDQPDAMLLERFFTSLPSHVILLFTSNQMPGNLYKKGQGRKFFQPFIDMVVSSLIVLKMESSVDFRRLGGGKEEVVTSAADVCATKLQHVLSAASRGSRPFADAKKGNGAGSEQEDEEGVKGMVCVGSEAGHQLQQCWQACCACADKAGPEGLQVGYGRSIWVPRTAVVRQGGGGSNESNDLGRSSRGDSGYGSRNSGGGPGLKAADLDGGSSSSRSSVSESESLAYFQFEELLGSSGLSSGPSGVRGALSATDFTAICKRYDVIFIEGVPPFNLALRDEARRFVVFVDMAYENKSRLALSLTSQVDLDGLFQPLLHAAYMQGMNPRQGISGRPPLALPPVEAIAAGLKEAAKDGIMLKQEEVLMYHRAASRLVEMCQ